MSDLVELLVERSVDLSTMHSGGDAPLEYERREWAENLAREIEAVERAEPVSEQSARPPTEYIIRIAPPHGKEWPLWLALHQCPICFALVVEDFLPDHLRWHGDETELPCTCDPSDDPGPPSEHESSCPVYRRWERQERHR